MKRLRFPFTLLWLGALALAASCAGDSAPTGPDAGTPSASLLGALEEPTGLLRCEPLPDATTSETIGPEGGTIRVGPHRLYVPPQALREPVTITAEAPSGTVNLVRFAPHGLTFERPVYLTMSYANCNTLGLLVPKRIAYTDDLLVILEYLLSWDNLTRRRVTGRLDHFSGYAVAW